MNLNIMKNFERLDLEPIMVKAMDSEEGYGWSIDFTKGVAIEYKRFLALCILFPDSAIVPSSIVDKFWHLHILDTQKYSSDCYLFIGYFLHHFPYFGMRGEEDKNNLTNAWFSTLEKYKSVFGKDANFLLWEKSNRCPNCGRRSENNATNEYRPHLSDVI